MARCDSASTTVPLKPEPSNWWKLASIGGRPASRTNSRHLSLNCAPSSSRRGSQRQPPRSPMRCRPFMSVLPEKREGAALHQRIQAAPPRYRRAAKNRVALCRPIRATPRLGRLALTHARLSADLNLAPDLRTNRSEEHTSELQS